MMAEFAGCQGRETVASHQRGCNLHHVPIAMLLMRWWLCLRGYKVVPAKEGLRTSILEQAGSPELLVG